MIKKKFNNGTIASQRWELDQIAITHSVVDYNSFGTSIHEDQENVVRLHFGLSGDYDFKHKQLNASFQLQGQHNNILYSNGIGLEVANKTKRVETFGLNFSVDAFVQIAQNGNLSLRTFADKVLKKENAILSNQWRVNNFKIQSIIQEIINCPYQADLKNLFLLSKSIELLVLQADLYEQQSKNTFLKSNRDKQKLFEAKEVLDHRIENPPTIRALAKLIQLNEYKLKKGFKALFGLTVFGYIHQSRMKLAQHLLSDTNKTAKEIAYEIGYSSPQHFSKAFKKEFGLTPNCMRKNPNNAID